MHGLFIPSQWHLQETLMALKRVVTHHFRIGIGGGGDIHGGDPPSNQLGLLPSYVSQVCK